MKAIIYYKDRIGQKFGWLPKYALIVPKNIRRGSEKYNEIITYCD